MECYLLLILYQYANKIYFTSVQIAKKLKTKKKVLYVLNRPGNKGGYIGWWNFGLANIKSCDWIVFVGNNDMIEYVFRIKDIHFETKNFSSKSGKTVRKKGFKTLLSYMKKGIMAGIPISSFLANVYLY